MHALTFIIIFIIGAIVAAGEGDWSGIAAIGQFIGGAALIIGFLLLMTNPVAMLIVGVVVFGAIFVISHKS